MLCQLISYLDGDFRLVQIWLLVCTLMLASVLISSGWVFYQFFWPTNVTFGKWRYKSNPAYPPVEKVRDEIIQTLKGLACSAIFPAISLHFSGTAFSQAFCGWGDHSLSYHAFTFVVVFLGSDFYEFSYHRLGHINFNFWKQHKHHHVFFNPSPFAVIADEWIDQLMRSLPLLLIPMLMPVNMDMLFFTYAIFFYFYGVYLHSGHELEWLSAHNSYFNTSFQHYCHHAKSVMNKPYHCGFFFKIWDNMFDCVYPPEKCFCAECSRSKGERTLEAFEKVTVPNYADLFAPKIWLAALPIKSITGM